MTIKSKVTEIEENWKPSFLTNEEFIYLQLEAIDGFIIIFSTSGQIFYISESVISLLGYIPVSKSHLESGYSYFILSNRVSG